MVGNKKCKMSHETDRRLEILLENKEKSSWKARLFSIIIKERETFTEYP